MNAPLSAIAKRAGVGQGSLYRHFPDRTALAAAVFEDNVAEIEAYTVADGRTLDDLFDIVVAQAVVQTALIDLIGTHRDDPAVVALGIRFRGVVVDLLERERTSGRVRNDVETADVTLLVGVLASELARTDAADREPTADRARALIRRALAP